MPFIFNILVKNMQQNFIMAIFLITYWVSICCIRHEKNKLFHNLQGCGMSNHCQLLSSMNHAYIDNGLSDPYCI